MVGEAFIQEPEVLPSQNLQLPVTAAGQAQRLFGAWLKHRTSGTHAAGLTSSGTSTWSASKCQVSVQVCSLEVLVGTTIILSCLLGAAGGWGRCLPSEVLSLHLLREMYSARNVKHALCPALVSVFLLLLCSAPCT